MTPIELQQKTKARQKVIAWLTINEPDEASRKEVIELCTKNIEYRKWFVETYCK